VDDLHDAVYACIGSACAKGRHPLAGKLPQGFLKLILNGLPGRLALPALVCTTVVADAQRNPHGLIKPASSTRRTG
jgi:hypothetical protein